MRYLISKVPGWSVNLVHPWNIRFQLTQQPQIFFRQLQTEGETLRPDTFVINRHRVRVKHCFEYVKESFKRSHKEPMPCTSSPTSNLFGSSSSAVRFPMHAGQCNPETKHIPRFTYFGFLSCCRFLSRLSANGSRLTNAHMESHGQMLSIVYTHNYTLTKGKKI